eukprot:CAMPEP_0201594906 /NCGR_PEP_ID=MMETSP0190_2-20130828/192076_1 /ASSEMBLY_ACC=CAM_ASM_000263 /TAXON_ID=37353 /ORGANISM="Rosalina sp." /LENGTH=300 /DNA_ID=CAMNT_0048054699 /DNA_START=770 /DNA_END=1672 /DNA_ORIENTATION=-
MWFMINGSMTYDDTTYVFVPGGAKTLCNDLCVDMCIVRSVGCDLPSCLNTCNQQLMDAGNPDDFQQLPTHPIVEDLMMVKPMPLDDDMVYYEDGMPLDGGIGHRIAQCSYTYDDTTYLFVPGGAKTLCNDLCVDMCVVKTVGCDLPSCLNTCNAQLIADGNIDDFQELPTHPIVEDIPMVVDMKPVVDPVEPEPEDDIFLVDTPQAPEYDQDAAQMKLNAMQKLIEASAAALRKLKANYAEQCAANPEKIGCNLMKNSIKKSIEGLKEQIEGYNSFAISFEIDIQVSVWMVDVDQVTAQP